MRSSGLLVLAAGGLLGALSPRLAAQAPAPVAHTVTIAGANDEWTSTGIKVAAGDLIVIFIGGKIVAGPVIGQVDANGRDNSGADVHLGFVEGKIGSGGTPFRVGQRFPFTAGDEVGTLRLRVSDTNYRDNSGSFTATIYLFPAAVVPAATNYVADD